jgi:hypothetical protein
MRIFFSSLLVIIGLTMACKQTATKNGWQRLRLNGKVKSTTDSGFSASQENGKWEKNGLEDYSPIQVVQFDQDGNPTAFETSMPYVHFYSKSIPTYNNKGVEIGGKNYNANQQITETYTIDSFYNNQYAAITIAYDSVKQMSRKIRWFYDAELHFIGMEMKDKKDSLLYKDEYAYDNENRMIKRVNKGRGEEKDKVTAYIYLTFDKQNNWTERLEINERSKFILMQRSIVYY